MEICFSEFKLDTDNEQLWRDEQVITLRPKAYAVLKYLMERPGRPVSKDELLKEVWPDAYVGDAVLKVCVGQLREALGDDSKSPRFIETSHRRGYRFIGAVNTSEGKSVSRSVEGHTPSTSSMRGDISHMNVVGRKEALDKMKGWLDKALGGG